MIVCEGEATEPNYFEGLRRAHRLASANVEVTGRSDPDPLSVVEFGLERYHEDGDYDRLYCVIDREGRRDDRFKRARQELQSVRTRDTGIHGVISSPCFEYWILLHFEYSARRYAHPDSPCGKVVDHLREHFPEYEKGMDEIYDVTKSRLDQAVKRSKRRLSEARELGSVSPWTEVHTLVEYLQNIRS